VISETKNLEEKEQNTDVPNIAMKRLFVGVSVKASQCMVRVVNSCVFSHFRACRLFSGMTPMEANIKMLISINFQVIYFEPRVCTIAFW